MLPHFLVIKTWSSSGVPTLNSLRDFRHFCSLAQSLSDLERKPAGSRSNVASRKIVMTLPKGGIPVCPLSDEVSNGQNGMTEHHLRPCKSHHLSDLLSHLRFVAVDCTLAAYRFVFPKRAFRNPLFGIRVKTPAVFTKHLAAVVPATAIHTDHGPDRFYLPLQSLHIFRSVSCRLLSEMMVLRPGITRIPSPCNCL